MRSKLFGCFWNVKRIITHIIRLQFFIFLKCSKRGVTVAVRSEASVLADWLLG
jgi:hypothetical protein